MEIDENEKCSVKKTLKWYEKIYEESSQEKLYFDKFL